MRAMTEPDEQPWVEYSLPKGEVLMPPDRYAVPASTLPILEPGTLVTWGDPGRYWIVDGGRAISQPIGSGAEEEYEVRQWVRPKLADPHARVTRRTADLWVYRPVSGQEERSAIDCPPFSPQLLFDRVLDDLLTPPPLLRPRPARELPSVTGHVVWQRWADGDWYPMVAVAEPHQSDGDILVPVVDGPERWYGLLGGLDEYEPVRVTLSSLWAY